MREIKNCLAKCPKLLPTFKHTSIGIEREGHRITEDGHLAKTPHPTTVDGSSHNQYIQRDFADTQMELVTPPVDTPREVMDWLGAIHDVAIRSLPEGEAFWPYSMPPQLPCDEDIHVAQLDRPEAIAYREYLVKAYGKKLQMVSGIHYNMQISPVFIEEIYKHQKHDFSDLVSYTSDFYLRLARNFLRYQWLIVYLFGATPLADPSFFEANEEPFPYPVRSIRNSRFGYVNHPDVTYTYDNLEDYVAELEANVQSGRLIAEKEFYSNVRLRGAGKARELIDQGIKYLEFRLLDIQPFAPYGLSETDITFMKYFILYLLWSGKDTDMAGVRLGNARKTEVAEEPTLEVTAYQDEGLAIIDEMEDMIVAIGEEQLLRPILQEMRARLLDPEKTPAGQVLKETPDVASWLRVGYDRALENRQKLWARPYQLEGFKDMELSTQILLFDAIQQGFHIDLLDRQEQLIRLTYDSQQEIIHLGNITRLDSMISYDVMENKEVAKEIVKEAGFTVPSSVSYQSLAAAQKDILHFVDRPLVVKPKSTNMGLGIAVFPHGQKEEVLQRALKEAFRHDDTVLLEAFMPGEEYRFFVLQGEALAVLKRRPANVEGDGQHTIQELVASKNKDPKRGKDHRTPLEKIKCGEAEALTLADQGLTFKSVPAAGQIVYLRENSNISTGGESIAVTDTIDPSYRKLAEEMAAALEVQVTGIDLLIPNAKEPAQADNYAFIEANYNPMMMMHIFPAQGRGVRLTKYLLKALFPKHPNLSSWKG